MSVKISASGEIRNDLLYFFREKSIVPIVGSGISAGLEAYRGKIPTGREYLAHMTEAITTNGELTDDEKSTLAHESFSRISDYYQNDDVVPADIRRKYLRDNFSGAEFPDEDPRKKFFEINWPYIYSLNLDDAIENSTQYKKVIRPDEKRQKSSIDSIHQSVLSVTTEAAVQYPDTFTVTYEPTTGTASSYGAAFTDVTSGLYYSGGYLGTLKIPSIGVNVKVYQGTDTDALAKGAGHFSDTSIWDGNVAIAGHNRGTNCYFADIHTLDIGDRVTFSTKLGTRTYSVTSVKKVSVTDDSDTGATAENCVTLYTCVRNQSEYRWCVRAVEVS